MDEFRRIRPPYLHWYHGKINLPPPPPPQPPGKKNKGVCHIVALPFTFLKYLNGEEELRKLKYFTMQKFIIFNKIL